MGSFNVACSISNISIGHKQEIRYLLLIPNKSKLNDVHKLLRTNRYSALDELFKPFGLPIAGRYNDAGGIQDVVHNSNTAIIEERYGLLIEEISAGIHRTESFYFPRSPFFNRLVKEDYQRAFKLMSLDDEMALEQFGFVEKGKFLVHPEQPKFKVKLDTKEFHFGVYKGNQLIFESFKVSILAQVLECIYQQTGVFLGVAKEDQQIASELADMSAMFIHEDVFKALSDSENTSIREGAISSSDFKEQVESLAGNLKLYRETYEALLATHSDKKQIKKMAAFGIHPPAMIPASMYDMLSMDEFPSMRSFEDMTLFLEHYRYKLSDSEITDLLFEFYYFKWAMRSANKMYLPAMNGEQNENHAATLHLANITQQIVQSKM